MVIVVGAGICGLAAAYELRKRGAEVLVLEAGSVPGGQSVGLNRIFRIAHRTERLSELALEARTGWQRWERELGLRLLGDEGLVVANGMWSAGEPLDHDEITRRVPLLRPDHPYEHGVWDPLAGSLDSLEALNRIAERVENIAHATVTAVDGDGSVHAGETIYTADAVLVCAGLGTQALIAPLGLDLRMTSEPHTRVTYPGGTGACLISPDCYALPTGLGYAIGMHDPNAQPDMFEGLGRPVSTTVCVSLFAPWLDHGDGFTMLRAGKVIAVGASNAMKFGPLLGAWLADAALGYGPAEWTL